jgi:hypothetical protein
VEGRRSVSCAEFDDPAAVVIKHRETPPGAAVADTRRSAAIGRAPARGRGLRRLGDLGADVYRPLGTNAGAPGRSARSSTRSCSPPPWRRPRRSSGRSGRI